MPRNSRWRSFVLCWVLLSLMSALWSLANPIAASPDEPDHFVKAASVVRGYILPPTGPENFGVRVPRYVAFTHAETCFAFQSERTADCSPTLTGDPGALTQSTTTARLYSPVYYFIVGWPSLIFHDRSGLYAMRIVSGIVDSLFLALAFAQLLELRRRGIAVLSFAVAVTPMVLFLMSSVNPNSLETTATLSVFVTTYMLVRHPDPRRLSVRVAILLASVAAAVTMRGLSPLWVAIVLLVPMLLLGSGEIRALLRLRLIRWAILGIAVLAALSIAWILASNSLGNGSLPGTPSIGGSPAQGFALVLLGTFSYDQGLVGDFGWLDTPAPLGVFFVWSVFVGMLVLLTVLLTRGRPRMIAIALLACVALLPPVLQGIYIHNGGIIWQGRYILPVFVCLVVALGLLLSEAMDLSPVTERLLAIIVLATWSFAQLDSFATNIRRYAVGLSGGIGQLVEHPAWSPPLGVIASIATFAALTAGTAVFLTLAARSQEKSAPAL